MATKLTKKEQAALIEFNPTQLVYLQGKLFNREDQEKPVPCLVDQNGMAYHPDLNEGKLYGVKFMDVASHFPNGTAISGYHLEACFNAFKALKHVKKGGYQLIKTGESLILHTKDDSIFAILSPVFESPECPEFVELNYQFNNKESFDKVKVFVEKARSAGVQIKYTQLPFLVYPNRNEHSEKDLSDSKLIDQITKATTAA